MMFKVIVWVDAPDGACQAGEFMQQLSRQLRKPEPANHLAAWTKYIKDFSVESTGKREES